ncbi:MAG TPA: hypothetical protein VI279_16120 [Rhodocyclaceae bacterium]
MSDYADIERRNAEPLTGCLDLPAVAGLLAERPHLLADTRVFVAAEHLAEMAAFAAAIERVVTLPAWQEAALAEAPALARIASPLAGVFFGYDFHITAAGPRLIEINTNAGGGLVNLALLRAQREALLDADAVASSFVAMFRTEAQAAGLPGLPACVAIVDDAPAQQFLLPDFEGCRDLLQAAGVDAVICDPGQLEFTDGALRLGQRRVDMVYNRLTDFALDQPEHAALAAAWAVGAVLLTPHPRNHALYADKRNLIRLSDEAWLAAIGVSTADRELIARVVPRTEPVTADRAEDFWSRRKELFFKPAAGYGARAVYRGAKLTKGVFDDILGGGYVAQALVPTPTRSVLVDGVAQALKYDLRCYTYKGELLLTTARLWQGQTTNMRTPGGGFAPVLVV